MRGTIKIKSLYGIKFPGKEKGMFAGVINFNHIIEYLLLFRGPTKEYPRIKSLAGLLK
jgi:hypothetical protein